MAGKLKACKNCGYLTEENTCPACGSKEFADKYKGKVVVFDKDNSQVAKQLGIEENGTYALKF